MKKKTLNANVTAYKNETANAIATILAAISAPGQKKKVLANENVKALLKQYNITT